MMTEREQWFDIFKSALKGGQTTDQAVQAADMYFDTRLTDIVKRNELRKMDPSDFRKKYG